MRGRNNSGRFLGTAAALFKESAESIDRAPGLGGRMQSLNVADVIRFRPGRLAASAWALVLLGAIVVRAPAAPPTPVVFEGHIKDIRGTDGTLTLTLRDGEQSSDRTFLIGEATIKGPDRAEWKVGDLREGDRVEVAMTADGRMARVVRVLPAERLSRHRHRP
jgi:hypothetical protein